MILSRHVIGRLAPRRSYSDKSVNSKVGKPLPKPAILSKKRSPSSSIKLSSPAKKAVGTRKAKKAKEEEDDDIDVPMKVTFNLENSLQQIPTDSHVTVGFQILEFRDQLLQAEKGEERATLLHQAIDHSLDLEAKLVESKGVKREPISCKKGCNHCCQQMIFVTDDEATLLAKKLRAKYADNIPEKVVSYLRSQAKYKSHQALEFWALPKEQSACVFLDNDGLCSVYVNRPAACRTVHSDPVLCSKERSSQGDGTLWLGPCCSVGLVDKSFSLGAEAWSSAMLNIEKVVHDPLPELLLKALDLKVEQ